MKGGRRVQQELTTQTVFFRKRSEKRKLWKRIVTGLASVVVFCTTYALILPAITMEGYVCGVTAHQHDENCYAIGPPGQLRTLVCDGGLSALHQHEDSCYTEGVLTCGYADYILHQHTEDCRDGEGRLICPLPEIAGHLHDESCWQQPHVHGTDCYTWQQGQLLCTIEEGTVHTHDDSCRVARQELICTQAEGPGHTHGGDCFPQVLICGLAEDENHRHDDGCVVIADTPQCGLEAGPGHTHGDTCLQTLYDLSCPLEEGVPHVHGDDCWERTQVLTCQQLTAEEGAQPQLICGQEQRLPHIHDDTCLDADGALCCGLLQTEEHTHGSLCFVITETEGEPSLCCGMEVHTHGPECLPPEEDPQPGLWADGRTCGMAEHQHGPECLDEYGALWCTIPEHTHWELCDLDPNKRDTADPDDSWLDNQPIPTGDPAADTAAVALAQVGYRESDAYYTVTDEAELRWYSRYADWWDGDGFSDWNAKLAAFCLETAGVTEVPLSDSAAQWPALLAEAELWQEAPAARAEAGRLAFFDGDGDGRAESVGIITEVEAESGGFTAVLEQNGRVREKHYASVPTTLLGVGLLERETAAPTLSQEEADRAAEVSAEIEALPADEEISATFAAFEDAEDEEGYNAYLAALLQQVQDTLAAYNALTPEQQAVVTNAERLNELEWLWSAETLTENFHFDEPAEVGYASTKDFIELNLYDYNGNINANYNSNKKYPGFQWNGGAYMYSSTFNRHYVDYIDFGNSNITDIAYGGASSESGKTNGYSQNRVQVGVLYTSRDAANTGAINRLWWNKDTESDITNRPVGMSTDVEALSRTLDDKGYPALADGSSLAYLFTNGGAVTKQNTESIDGLFQQDEKGAYYYNSRWNHAQYSDNQFTLYDQIITPNFIVYPFGNFLPFNTITDSTKATQVSSINGSSGTTVSDYVQKIQNDLTSHSNYNGSPTRQQLNAMLEKYQTSINGAGIKCSKAAIVDYFTAGGGSGDKPSSNTDLIDTALLNKMYNIDWDEETNFFFGMDMSMNFMQPKDGLTGNDGQQPMEFYFTGDDDVWVYIDGVLFLDLTGIHRHVGGKIDFVNGTVDYYALDTEKGDVDTNKAYKTYTFAELLKAAGKSTDGLNEKGTFKDYTTHSFKFFYMERGSGSSVCRMNFNFPLLRKNSISVSKELSVDDESKLPLLGNPDFKFQVLKENKTDLFIGANVRYDILDASGSSIGTGYTDANGVFTLKAGQTAVFSGIQENAGKYFVRELLDASVFEQYGTVSVDGNYDVTVGNDTFKGVESPVKDVSDGSTAFRFDNRVATTKLGQLSITKRLLGSTATPEETYNMCVKLDDKPLPVGTKCEIGGEKYTVETAGIIPLQAGQTAVLQNILAGTKFQVTEEEVSAGDFIVSYRVDNGDISPDSAEGTVGVEAAVEVVVTNQYPYELPETGGGGAGWYYAAGALLCAAAGLLLVRQSRRKGDAPSS